MGLRRLEKITRAYVIAVTYRVDIIINDRIREVWGSKSRGEGIFGLPNVPTNLLTTKFLQTTVL